MTLARILAVASSSAALWASHALAQAAPPAPANSPGAVVLPTIEVFATTPLSGTGVDVDKVPAARHRSSTPSRSSRTQSPSIVKSLAQQTPSVDVQDVSGNPFQPDVYFRGFDASPVSGTPQGLAVYQNGVRINEAFGDTVNWDLIPTAAVRSIDVISNNPAFGLNALGGALSVQMKDGFSFQGTSIDVMGGSYGRAAIFAAMGQAGRRLRRLYRHRGRAGQRLSRYFGARRSAASTATSATRATAPSSISASAAPTTAFGATAAAPAELLAAKLEQRLYDAAILAQSGRLRQRHRERQRHADLDAAGRGACSLVLSDRPSTAIRPTRSPAPIRRSCASTTPSRPPTASTASSSPTRSPPARRSAKSTARRRRRRASGRPCRRPIPTSCSATTIISSIGGSFDYGVTNFGASAELGRHPAQLSRRRVGRFSGAVGRSGLRRSGLAAHDQRLYAGSTRSTRST